VDEMPPGERPRIFTPPLSYAKCLTAWPALLETDFVVHSNPPEPNLLLQALVGVSLSGCV
jgi:hypothetical protein